MKQFGSAFEAYLSHYEQTGQLLKSKQPYVEHNLDTAVNIIRHSIQNAAAFEVAAQLNN